MLQTSQTTVINAQPDQIWVLLNDMIARPERYEDTVILKKLSGEGPVFQRLVTRDGVRIQETIEIHRDALMVELSVHGEAAEPLLSIIHQVVPSGARTILNLAATWQTEELEGDPASVNTETIQSMTRRLAGLGARVGQLAEALNK
jgi:carbon monoxide dehydrogenase subunit G